MSNLVESEYIWEKFFYAIFIFAKEKESYILYLHPTHYLHYILLENELSNEIYRYIK